jgi:hypothetical protein
MLQYKSSVVQLNLLSPAYVLIKRFISIPSVRGKSKLGDSRVHDQRLICTVHGVQCHFYYSDRVDAVPMNILSKNAILEQAKVNYVSLISKQPIQLALLHNIIQIHNSVLWDW